MSGRSPSGVASLRARFEDNKESSSSPSRGRSPAGSVASDTSRPISKVRTSFVSVEGSGKMRDLLGPNEAASKENVAGDAGEKPNPVTNGAANENPKPNDDSTLPQNVATALSNETDTKQSVPETPSTPPTALPGAVDGSSDIKPDKPVSTIADSASGMLPADPKGEQAISGEGALGKGNAELGSILKGSPFEATESKKGEEESSKPEPASSPLKHSIPKTQHQSIGLTNGKTKAAQGSNPALLSNSKTDPSTNPGPSSAAAKSPSPRKNVNESTKSQTKVNSNTIPPISTAKDAPTSKPKISPSAPQTPTSATAKQSASNKSSPKPGASKDNKREPINGAKKPAVRPPASKPPTAVSSKAAPASNTSNAKSYKISGPTSPKTAFVKPRPKSPTRPVRLPAAATAPTAASAAKLDGAPSTTNERKLTNVHSGRDRVSSNPVKSHPKPMRSSLPGGSKPIEKFKPPRMSMASSKAPEGSFLERMTRPTQSSSQKTHEKIDTKSPPAKPQSKRVPRISQGSDKSKSEHEEAKPEPPRENPISAPKEDLAEPNKELGTTTDKVDHKVDPSVAS